MCVCVCVCVCWHQTWQHLHAATGAALVADVHRTARLQVKPSNELPGVGTGACTCMPACAVNAAPVASKPVFAVPPMSAAVSEIISKAQSRV